MRKRWKDVSFETACRNKDSLMRGWLCGSIAELIKTSNVGGDQTVFFITVIEIHGAEFVLG